VKCSRRLLTAKHIDGRWKGRNKCRRHCQARPDYQGEQNKDHEQVGEPLEQVIRPCLSLNRPLEAQMAGDRSRECPP